MAKYIEVDVEKAREIRQDGHSYQDIADYFGVGRTKIYSIVGKIPAGKFNTVKTVKVEKEPIKPFLDLNKIAETFKINASQVTINYEFGTINISSTELNLEITFDRAKDLFAILAKTLNYIEKV